MIPDDDTAELETPLTRARRLGLQRAAKPGITASATGRAARLGIGSALGSRAARLGLTAAPGADGDQEKSA